MAVKEKGLMELFVHTLKDVYFAENAITKALPKMIKAATNKDLKAGFEKNLKQTQEQIERLDQVFKSLDMKPAAVPCEAIKGILKEGDEVAEEFDGSKALDAGLIAAAQAVEHYEISRYGAMHAWAEQLDLTEAAELLHETLSEEEETDQLLTELASAINEEAAA